MHDASSTTWFDGAEARVVVVVVDVEDPRLLGLERVGGLRSMLPQSRKTIVRSSRSSGGVRLQAVEVEEAVLVGQRELVGGHEHHRVLAERPQHAVHRDERAERVAVGVLVRDEDEALAVAQLVEDALARLGLRRRSCVALQLLRR